MSIMYELDVFLFQTTAQQVGLVSSLPGDEEAETQ